MAYVQTSDGLKPALSKLDGRPTTLAQGSYPLSAFPGTGSSRSITLTGDGWRTISYAKLYRTQPAIGTNAKRLTEQTARLPLQLYRWQDPAGESRTRDRQHPAARLLARPRPRRTGFHLRWEIALSLFVNGSWLAWRRRPRAGQPPTELWTLDWRFVEPILSGDDAGPILAWRWLGRGIPGLEYGAILTPDEVIYIGFDAPDGQIGVSPLEQLGVTVRSEDAIQRYAEAMFRHGQRYGAAAILDKSVKADQVTRDGVREELAAVHGGVDNAFKTAVLGGGIIDLKEVGGQTAVEAELVNQRKVNREEAAMVYGLVGPLAGIFDSNAYAALKEVHRMLYVTTLAGPLGLVSEGLQAQLINDEPAWAADDVFLEFNLGEVLKGDVKERMDAYAVAIDHGILTLNDVRRLENQEPYEDERADEPLIAANNVRPLSAVGQDAGASGDVANSILGLVGKSAGRALERAAKRVGAGDSERAWDGDRFKRELGKDLEELGLNGSSTGLADAVANALERDLADAKSADDVRALLPRYSTPGGRQ